MHSCFTYVRARVHECAMSKREHFELFFIISSLHRLGRSIPNYCRREASQYAPLI
jgi:hypothetical protein